MNFYKYKYIKGAIKLESLKKYKHTYTQKEIVEENFRLIYVGITRAIAKLFLSVSDKTYNVFKNNFNT